MPTNYTDLSRIKEHPYYQLSDKVAEICAPLFNNFTINYFGYACMCFEGNRVKMFGANSNKKWLSYYLSNNYPVLCSSKKTCDWLSIMPTDALTKAGSYDFNQYNGILVGKKHLDYIECFEFASPNPHVSPLEFCVNKEILNKFILYFKYKAGSIIKASEREPLLLPTSKVLKAEDPYQPSYNKFYQAIKMRKLPLRLKNQEVLLSQREFDILSLLVKGKTMREIAQILNISSRTVETYIYTTKDKTNAFTTSHLLDLFADSLF